MLFEYEFVPVSELEKTKRNTFGSKEFPLLKEGEASFVIEDAEVVPNKTSGGKQLKVTFNIRDCTGTIGKIWEYFQEKPAWKIKGFLDGIGCQSLYGKPIRAEDIIRKSGKCNIKIKKSDDSRYPDRNVISYYLKSDNKYNPEPSKKEEVKHSNWNPEDDDLPF